MRSKTPYLALGVVAAIGISHGAPIRRIVTKTVPNYTSKPQRFAVWLPAKVARTKNVSGPTPQGETIEMFFAATGIEPIFYTVAVAKNPPSAMKMKPEKRLSYARDAMMQSSTSKIVSEKRVQLGQFPGRDIQMTVASGTEGQRLRIYTTPQRTYQVVARAPHKNMRKYSAQITKVFDSLRILPQ